MYFEDAEFRVCRSDQPCLIVDSINNLFQLNFWLVYWLFAPSTVSANKFWKGIEISLSQYRVVGGGKRRGGGGRGGGGKDSEEGEGGGEEVEKGEVGGEWRKISMIRALCSWRPQLSKAMETTQDRRAIALTRDKRQTISNVKLTIKGHRKIK